MGRKSINIVIPIYNEEAELAQSIKKLHFFSKKNLLGFKWKITIADNASTDNSPIISKKLIKKFTNVCFVHLNKKGRGRAVKKVWRESKDDILVYMDVDLSTDLNSLRPLIESLDVADIAIGSRLLPESEVIGRTLKREILSRAYNIIIKLLFQTRFSDAQCGFKAVTRKIVTEVLPLIEDNAWFFDSELLIIAEKSGYKIYEVPVIWVDNPGSTVRVLKTVMGDLAGLWRLFIKKPWERKEKIK